MKAMMRYNGQFFLQEVYVDSTKQLITRGEETTPIEQLVVHPPVSGTVYGTLLNYKGELEALGSAVCESPYQQPPKAPILYIKPVNTINYHQASIPMPKEEDTLQIGAALAVVIGKKQATYQKKKYKIIFWATQLLMMSVFHIAVFTVLPSRKKRKTDSVQSVHGLLIEKSWRTLTT